MKIMLAISLMRMGAKGKPFYRLVVKEKRSKARRRVSRKRRHVRSDVDPAEVNLKHDRIQYWIGVGAQPTGDGCEPDQEQSGNVRRGARGGAVPLVPIRKPAETPTCGSRASGGAERVSCQRLPRRKPPKGS